jgi:hypothetical protein
MFVYTARRRRPRFGEDCTRGSRFTWFPSPGAATSAPARTVPEPKWHRSKEWRTALQGAAGSGADSSQGRPEKDFKSKTTSSRRDTGSPAFKFLFGRRTRRASRADDLRSPRWRRSARSAPRDLASVACARSLPRRVRAPKAAATSFCKRGGWAPLPLHGRAEQDYSSDLGGGAASVFSPTPLLWNTACSSSADLYLVKSTRSISSPVSALLRTKSGLCPPMYLTLQA